MITEKLKAKNLKLKTITKNLKLYALSLSFALYALHFTLVATQPVYALDSTPSADIKSKLEELKKEIASKAAKLKEEMDRKLKNKAYVGNIKSFSETSVTLAALSGPKMVSINQDTVFEDRKSKSTKGSKKFPPQTLSEDDYVAALGDTDETGVLIAKKIILLPGEIYTPKISLWGQIISAGEKLLTIRDKDFKNIAVTILSDVKVKLNDFVIMTGNIDKNEIFEASFIYVTRQGGVLKPKRLATPSASVATASAKPTTKPASPKPKGTSR